jgi:hypothetical protein
MNEICIGPNACGECGGEYGEHSDWCSRRPDKLPFKPTMNLRYRLGHLEQEFVRPDGATEWRSPEVV